ncbi:MAG: D-ribose pyranase [Lacrimispora sphenoides]
MKRNGILNSSISSVLSSMGHTDSICIGDCGLPIPDETKRIDLALRFNIPSFLETLDAVSDDMAVESYILAEEMKDHNPEMVENIRSMMKKKFPDAVECFTSHENLKEQTKTCKAVIRTGEITAFANIILVSACIFAAQG